jgi:4-hydroxy-2-oxoheptanedioate aldolase
MRKNIVKEKLQRGEPSIGTWVAIGNPLVAEILAHAGFDWLTMDMEHNAIDIESLQNCFYAISTTDTVPFVRVPWNDPQILKRVLDIGAFGVVVPNVKTPEEAEMAVQACRYPPEGFRGVGSIRGRLYGGPDYFQKANEEIAVILMIEDTQAVRRIAEICNVPGIDSLFIGPNDLAASLGVPVGYDNPHPDHKAAVSQILQTGKRFNVPVGIHCGSAAEVNRRIEEGFQWMPIASLGVPVGYDNPHPDHKAAVSQILQTGKRFNVPVGIHCGSAAEVNRRIEEGFQWMPIVSDARFLSSAVQSAMEQVKLPSLT